MSESAKSGLYEVYSENRRAYIQEMQTRLNEFIAQNRLPQHDMDEVMRFAVDCGNIDICRYLLNERRVDVNHVIDSNNLLHVAALRDRKEIARLLIQKGINVNLADADGVTALHKAVICSDIKMVMILVEEGRANIDVQDRNNKTPFFLAIKKMNQEVCDFFIFKGVKIGGSVNERNRLLHNALSQEKDDIAIAILKESPEPNPIISHAITVNDFHQTALHVAALYNRPKVIEYMINERGVEVSVLDSTGQTPFFTAFSSHQVVTSALEILLKHGARFDERESNGDTLLHKVRNFQTAEFLLKQNLDVNVQNSNGDTPLHVICANPNVRLILFLIQNNANPRILNSNLRTPLHSLAYVVENHLYDVDSVSNVIKILLKNGCKASDCDDSQRTVIDIFEDVKRKIVKQKEENESALSSYKQEELPPELVGSGVDDHYKEIKDEIAFGDTKISNIDYLIDGLRESLRSEIAPTSAVAAASSSRVSSEKARTFGQ